MDGWIDKWMDFTAMALPVMFSCHLGISNARKGNIGKKRQTTAAKTKGVISEMFSQCNNVPFYCISLGY